VRTKVNDLLAGGASYAMVLRALGDDNAELEKRDRVTTNSIRNHTVRHFPVQQVARATYREILERRATDDSVVDFIEGVATAVTPLAGPRHHKNRPVFRHNLEVNLHDHVHKWVGGDRGDMGPSSSPNEPVWHVARRWVTDGKSARAAT
jgi:hypothetical protein